MNFGRILLLLVVTCLSLLSNACNQYDPYNPDNKNLEGVWSIDNTISRRADEPPVWKTLTVYATHMEFCPGQGTVGTRGKWRDGGIWCTPKDGSGEFEAVKVISPETVELNLAAFFAGNKEVLILYKQKGSEEDERVIQREMKAKYLPPLSYPPPSGVITTGMTEYQLKELPWKADDAIPSPGESTSDDATIYRYHSDNPTLIELRVVVKNHVVIAINGGNG